MMTLYFGAAIAGGIAVILIAFWVQRKQIRSLSLQLEVQKANAASAQRQVDTYTRLIRQQNELTARQRKENIDVANQISADPNRDLFGDWVFDGDHPVSIGSAESSASSDSGSSPD